MESSGVTRVQYILCCFVTIFYKNVHTYALVRNKIYILPGKDNDRTCNIAMFWNNVRYTDTCLCE